MDILEVNLYNLQFSVFLQLKTKHCVSLKEDS